MTSGWRKRLSTGGQRTHFGVDCDIASLGPLPSQRRDADFDPQQLRQHTADKLPSAGSQPFGKLSHAADAAPERIWSPWARA